MNMYRAALMILTIAVALLSVHAIVVTDVGSVVAQGTARVPLLAEIVNTPENPVPVSIEGETSISGAVSASQEGNWAVEIDPNANLVKVEQLDDATRDVFSATVSMQFPESVVNISSFFSVPAGKRLVIEHVSARGFLFAPDATVSSVQLRSTPIVPVDGPFFVNAVHHVPLSETRAFLGTAFVGSETVKIYVDGGTNVEIAAGRSIGTGTGNFTFTMSGYLVDMPE